MIMASGLLLSEHKKNHNQITAISPAYHNDTMPSKSVMDPDLLLLVIGTLIELGAGHGSSHDAVKRYTKRCSIPDRDAGRECNPEICFYNIDSNEVIS
jgi:hypothetical protein